MSARGEARAFMEAQRREEKISRRRCPLCKTKPALVRVTDGHGIEFICLSCAKKFISDMGPGCGNHVFGLIQLSYCDNLPDTNYRSKKVEQPSLF